MAWITNYRYRKSFILSRPSGAVTNYQVQIFVGESSGASGESVDCGGYCLPSFNDLRFTNSDGTTLLDYWVESISGTTPNQLATVWVEFDSISTVDTTFYMYYGYDAAVEYSNGANTFQFFDDFTSPTLDTTIKWIVGAGTPSLSNSILTLPSGARIRSKSTFPINTMFRSNLMYASNSEYAGFGYLDEDTYGALFYAHKTLSVYYSTLNWHNWNHLYGSDESGPYIDGDENVGKGAYYTFNIRRNAELSVHYQIDENVNVIAPLSVPTINLPIALNGASQVLTSKWVFVSQYLGTPPTVGSWGSEEEETVESVTRRDSITISGITPKIPSCTIGVSGPQGIPNIKIKSLLFSCDPSDSEGTLTVTIVRTTAPLYSVWYETVISPGTTSLLYEHSGRSLVSPNDKIILSYTNSNQVNYTGMFKVDYPSSL